MTQKLSPPRAQKRSHTQVIHGFEKQDNYHWLRADNWQEVMQDPALLPGDIRDYLEAENNYSAEVMAATQNLQDKLFAELKGRIKQDDSSVPAADGEFAYYTSFITGGQQPIFARKNRDLSGPEQVILDGNLLSAGKDYFRFGGVAISPDQHLAAWSYDDKGSEFYEIRIRDIASGHELEDKIHNSTGDVSWAADGRSFFYTAQDEHHRPLKTYHHVLGTLQTSDRLVYEEKDTGKFTGIATTSSERFIVLSIHDHDTSENWLIDAQAPSLPPRLIVARVNGVEDDIEHWEDSLIIKTNRDGAEDYKIMIAPLAAPAVENWKDLVAYREGRFIVSVLVFKDWLVWLERENALPRIWVRNLRSGEEHDIAFDEEAYSLGFGEMREFDSEVLRFSYSSMTTPTQVYDYNMADRSRVLRKSQEIPSGHNPADYVTKRLMAPSTDGELVPITLLAHKNTRLDGSAPLWLYGYGAYGLSLPAGFNSNILSLVERGFVYAIAHIRGGQEKGRRWYKMGKLEHKPNSFHDFIAVGDYLVANHYTSRGRIVAHGASAGGMLMGAVANMRPDLFGAIIAEVPFVDVLSTMLDETLPLTPPEWPEWGNPIRDKAAYEVISGYSPYDNVRSQTYPPLLAVGGLTDPRVTYWEPAKWVAQLRDKKTDENLLLLKTNMGAGHGGASGRFDRLKEVAFVYAFGLKITDPDHVA